MEIKIGEKDFELDLGIGFALNLDSKYKFVQKVQQDLQVEFGMGVQLLYGRLKAVSIESILDFYKAGLMEYKKGSYTVKDLEKAIEREARELGGFNKLADKCIDELVNVGLYPHIFEAEKLAEEMNSQLTNQQEEQK